MVSNDLHVAFQRWYPVDSLQRLRLIVLSSCAGGEAITVSGMEKFIV